MLCEMVVFKDLSVGLMKVVYVLIVFVTGIVIGLMSSSHVDRYFTTQPYSLDRIRASASLDSMYKSSVTSDPNCSIRSSGVGSCVTEDCLSMESFRFPKNLSHRMTDEELFWRGSLVPEKKEYPFDRMPKIAFMFLTRGRLPFVPLWERFFKGQDVRKYSIYVHTDPMFELGVANTSVFYKRQIPSQAVKWGSVSLVDAERRLLGNALLDFSNERFVLLSESCIPIHNFPTIYKYLVNSVYSYLDSYDDPSKYGRGRYSRHMKPDIRLRDWRKGSQWFEMHRELAIKIISDTKYYNLFHKYCTEDCYPDEHYMPTFVHMFHGSLNADRTVTYVDWSIGGPHPKSFGPKDITDSFMKSLRNNGTTCSFNKGTTPVCYLFARKFNETALEPLLKLDPEVLGY
ncbi:glycosyl transferase, family 14 [Artemisia annua]|uniref:Glycosyl transferase, family 14 n=1 Tax=Artemisia annua TaxID=35608 RepID=A0A2U1M0S4_ARTAN|nr:glycosyl transferase, family 14 [Artemisia annua]